MNFISFLTKIFIWILIIISAITIVFGLASLLRINKEISSGSVLFSFIGIELILQIAYLIGGIGILKNRPWALYITISFLSIGVLLQVLNKDIGLVLFYVIIISLLVLRQFFNKKVEGIRG